MEVRPTASSFLRKYLSALTPLYFVAAYEWPAKHGQSLGLLVLVSVIPVLAIAWTLRNREATGSLSLFVLVATVWAAYRLAPSIPHTVSVADIVTQVPYVIKEILAVLPSVVTTSALLASILVLLFTEAYRRSITYVIGETEILMRGGILRRQEHAIPYDKIGRVILEQGLLGRLLNYGTIIPVGLAAWGEEYYTRAVGAGGGGHGLVAGVGYARTLQEISRDPLKVLYGVPNPERVYRLIEDKVSFTYAAERRKVELLESMDKKLSELTQSNR